MATKGNLLTAINTQLTAIITQAKVRLASALIVDELYPATIEEFYAPPANVLSITNFLVPDFEYKIKFKKVGNTVFVDGSFTNETGVIFSGDFLEIVNAEYLPKTSEEFNSVTDLSGRLKVLGDKFSTTSVGASEKHYFNFTYTTND